jgi:hypothetical protein
MNHGEAKLKTTKRKYRIIEGDNCYRVKKKFGPFYFFIRTHFKRIEFDNFGGVVRYVIERKRLDNGRKLSKVLR